MQPRVWVCVCLSLWPCPSRLSRVWPCLHPVTAVIGCRRKAGVEDGWMEMYSNAAEWLKSHLHLWSHTLPTSVLERINTCDWSQRYLLYWDRFDVFCSQGTRFWICCVLMCVYHYALVREASFGYFRNCFFYTNEQTMINKQLSVLQHFVWRKSSHSCIAVCQSAGKAASRLQAAASYKGIVRMRIDTTRKVKKKKKLVK